MLFACAQKNAGPAGVTIVIIRDDLLATSPDDLPSMLNYRVLAENKSLLNTPPTFAIYMVKLVTDWLLDDIGGLDKMPEINRSKVAVLYEAIDALGRLLPAACRAGQPLDHERALPPGRRRAGRALPQGGGRPADCASSRGTARVGGCRASIYNAMPIEGVQSLRDFMLEFCPKYSGK